VIANDEVSIRRKSKKRDDSRQVREFNPAAESKDDAKPDLTPPAEKRAVGGHSGTPRGNNRQYRAAARGKLSGKQVAGIVAGLLAVHFIIAVSSVRHKSPTWDESYHVTRGYTYWKTGDFRMAPAHPPLSSLWATNPLVAVPANMPPYDQQNWYQSDIFSYGLQFFYVMGNDIKKILQRSRSMMAVMSVFLGLVIFLWSRCIFGDTGGILSCLLYAFSPTMLAHCRLVTTDLFVAVFYLSALAATWAVLRRMTILTLLASGFGFAALFLSKLTAFFVLPILALLILIRILSKESLHVQVPKFNKELTRQPEKLLACTIILAINFVIVYGSIWAAYGFRFDAFKHNVVGKEQLLMAFDRDSGFDPWDYQYGEKSRVKPVLEFCRKYELFPELYLYSIATAAKVSASRASFLDGKHSLTGFRAFFPKCFLYKTPLPLMAILLCALWATFLGWRRAASAAKERAMGMGGQLLSGLYRTAPLWLLLGSYWVLMLCMNLNIGHRHILPTYPPMFVLAGGAIGLVRHPSRVLKPIVPILAGMMVIAALSIYPHYLAYFNWIAGGPGNGYRHLVDSSLDWGQDIDNLRGWLDKNARGETAYFAFFGSGPPRFFNVPAYALPYESFAYNGRQSIGTGALGPGIYCISATHLQQVYRPGIQEWTTKKEDIYWRFLPHMREFEDVPPDDEATLLKRLQEREPEFPWLFQRFQEVRFAKLCAYLRDQPYDDHVGYSILIYRLDADELNDALYVDKRKPSRPAPSE